VTLDPAQGPLFFAKRDIKDGFWCLVVTEDNAWHFCYILPNEDRNAPTQLVIPTCLQMDWCKATPFFCTTSEMAQDIAQEFLDSNQDLPKHPLNRHCIPDSRVVLPQLQEPTISHINHLLEVYMDNFLGLTQAPTHCELVHFTQAVLHGIHSIFLPPGPQKNLADKPISNKKLQQGNGIWCTQNEILGCINLPVDKVAAITHSLKELSRHPTICIGTLK